jgi:hypothetical protein
MTFVPICLRVKGIGGGIDAVMICRRFKWNRCFQVELLLPSRATRVRHRHTLSWSGPRFQMSVVSSFGSRSVCGGAFIKQILHATTCTSSTGIECASVDLMFIHALIDAKEKK